MCKEKAAFPWLQELCKVMESEQWSCLLMSFRLSHRSRVKIKNLNSILEESRLSFLKTYKYLAGYFFSRNKVAFL